MLFYVRITYVLYYKSTNICVTQIFTYFLFKNQKAVIPYSAFSFDRICSQFLYNASFNVLFSS